MNVEQSELGKKSAYKTNYDPTLLFPIARQLNRDKIAVPDKLPFVGLDFWNHYEVSWLNSKGKPIVALAEIDYPCDSINIIESKSMKLYFNSFNNTQIDDIEHLETIIKNDLESRIQSPVNIRVIPISEFQQDLIYRGFEGICLDTLDIDCSIYQLTPSFLHTEDEQIGETVYSDLMKSNCLVTNQPDWGSIQISYQGNKINHAGLLRYIVSFRNCNEFSETCIERIFMDIMQFCAPNQLTVYGRFTRRGGLDINPIRSTHPIDRNKINLRFCRQ